MESLTQDNHEPGQNLRQVPLWMQI